MRANRSRNTRSEHAMSSHGPLWRNDDLRRFIMNGIVWTGRLEVPASGVQTTPPDLATCKPESGAQH